MIDSTHNKSDNRTIHTLDVFGNSIFSFDIGHFRSFSIMYHYYIYSYNIIPFVPILLVTIFIIKMSCESIDLFFLFFGLSVIVLLPPKVNEKIEIAFERGRVHFETLSRIFVIETFSIFYVSIGTKIVLSFPFSYIFFCVQVLVILPSDNYGDQYCHIWE